MGPLERIEESYAKLVDWAKAKGVKLGQRVFERYVVDYWTTRNREEFVTELIIPLEES